MPGHLLESRIAAAQTITGLVNGSGLLMVRQRRPVVGRSGAVISTAWLGGLACLLVLPLASAHGEQHFDGPIQRIAFGSCADQNEPQPIWDTVLAAEPEVFVLLGDNIYADTRDMSVMRAKYEKFAAVEGFQRVRAKARLLATWDDHDYGENDAGADYPMKAQSQQEFFRFLNEPADSLRRKREGVYGAYTFGPAGRRVQIILLDTRYFRSPLKRWAAPMRGIGPYAPNDDPRATMLGEDQWTWLEQQFREPADLRIIGSSIQVVAEDHGWERWAEMPHQRRRLFDLIRQTQANGIIFISGDRHLAELSMADGGVGYPLFDLTSSSLNKSARRWRPLEANRHRVGTMNYGDNFGLIEIQWRSPTPQVRLQIRDVEGDIIIQRKVPLSLLSMPAATTPASAQ
jgi:alkaline phosphatase D